MRDLPADFSVLKNLRLLHLSGLDLEALPQQILNLESLRSLILSENKLRFLPARIETLKQLQRLDLRDNELTALPEELGRLRALEEAAQRDFEPVTEGLWLENNPLPTPYPLLIAEGQPKATTNVLSWLRGELRLIDLSQPVAPPDPEENPAEDLDDSEIIIEQRPGAFRFGIREGKIDSLPEELQVSDLEVAKDLCAELMAKATELQSRLLQTNSDPRAVRSVQRLLESLSGGFEQIRAGRLLSRTRSIESDRKAFDSPEARKELFPDSISMLDDVLLTSQDLLAMFPVIRKMEAERLALAIQSNAEVLEEVTWQTKIIKAEARASPVVTVRANAALTENDSAIEDARTIDLRAGLVADQLLVVRNFLSAAVSFVGKQTVSATVIVGAELGELGADVWKSTKEGLPEGTEVAAKVLPLTLVAALLAYVTDPVTALASLSPAGFRPLLRAVEKLRGGGKIPNANKGSPVRARPSKRSAKKANAPKRE
jgi:hypothetical protein